jgi:hypothetical protein
MIQPLLPASSFLACEVSQLPEIAVYVQSQWESV